jgi:hypothetical protein
MIKGSYPSRASFFVALNSKYLADRNYYYYYYEKGKACKWVQEDYAKVTKIVTVSPATERLGFTPICSVGEVAVSPGSSTYLTFPRTSSSQNVHDGNPQNCQDPLKD